MYQMNSIMNSEKEKRYLIGEEDHQMCFCMEQWEIEDWSRVVEEMPRSFTIIVPTCRGCGAIRVVGTRARLVSAKTPAIGTSSHPCDEVGQLGEAPLRLRHAPPLTGLEPLNGFEIGNGVNFIW
jgi:hypothetical protein